MVNPGEPKVLTSGKRENREKAHWRVVPTGGRYPLEGGTHSRVVPIGGWYPLEGAVVSVSLENQ